MSTMNLTPLQSEGRHDQRASFEAVDAQSTLDATVRSISGFKNGSLVMIDWRPLFRECFARSVCPALGMKMTPFSSVDDWLDAKDGCDASLIVISVVSLSEESARQAVARAVAAESAVPSVVMANFGGLGDARLALELGARGYILMDTDIELAARALRFVSLGGDYVPSKCLMTASVPQPVADADMKPGLLTSRELAVLCGIRQGKLNKTIAYELNMCEGTVKVHVRHILKKLNARNRTEVAIKATELLDTVPRSA